MNQAGHMPPTRPSGLRMAKYTLAGNTFLIVDETQTPLADDGQRAAFASWALDESFGIGGSDNILYLHRLTDPSRHSKRAPWTFRIFEWDGAETLFCGNGLLSAAAELNRVYGGMEWQVVTELPTGQPRTVRIGVGPSPGQAWVNVGHPRAVPAELYRHSGPSPDAMMDVLPDIAVPVHPDRSWAAGLPHRLILSGTLVSIGEPHLVLFSGIGFPSLMEDRLFPARTAGGSVLRASNQLVEYIGEYVNSAHRDLFPVGIHLNFARIADGQLIEYRTYERAIDRETLACGSGAVATAHVAALLGLVNPARATIWPYRSRLRQPDSCLWVDADESGYVLRGSPQLICTSVVPIDVFPVIDGAASPTAVTAFKEVLT
jgi:diaminopimelate epimerase